MENQNQILKNMVCANHWSRVTCFEEQHTDPNGKFKRNWKINLEVSSVKGHVERLLTSEEEHAFSTSLFSCQVAYHLSRSALMLVQAAGTGTSAVATGVSESDMSVVLGGVPGACPVL